MKTKIKRHCRSAVSVLLSVCMLISCVAVGLIGTDAAQVDDDSMVGVPADADQHYVVYNSAGADTVKFNSAGVATVIPTETGTMYFHITRDGWGNDGVFNYWESQTINADGTEYELYQHKANNTDNNTQWPGLSVTKDTTYYFTLTQTGDTVKYTVTTLPCIKYGTSDTGQNSELTLVKNASNSNLYESSAPLTISSGNLFFRPYINGSYPWDKGSQSDTGNVSVAFGAGTANLFDNTYGKQGNNSVPGNVFARIAPTAEGADLPYNFSYNATTKTVTVTCAAAVNLTVDSISGATTASVTVGSTTVNAGSSGTVTPRQQATITVTLSDLTKKISKAYYNGTAVKMVSSHNGTYSGTFTVPNEDTNVTFDVTPKSSYKVKVAVNDPSYGTAAITSADDGAYSESATYTEDTPIVLSATAAGAEHPFQAWDKGTDKTNASATYYVDGDDCDVGDPSTITITAVFKTNYYKANAKIFGDTDYVYQGVSARFFDYYYDKEIKDGWLNYTENEAKDDNRQPYTILNQALKTYAAANSVPVPLYFGNLYTDTDDVYNGMYGATTPTDISGVTGNKNSLDYHFYWAANNSNGIKSLYGEGNSYDYGHALTGLTGKSLNSNDNITHVSDKDSAANADAEVEMKLFDKDWLTSRSGDGYAYTGPLATIIDSPFPFVKETIKRIYLENVGSYNKAYTWSSYNGKDYQHSGDRPGTDVLYDSEKGKKYINVSTLAEKLELSNNGSTATSAITIDWNHNCYNVDTGTWSNVTDDTEANYYSFDSKDGQDNAFFKGIRDGEASPRMCYYFDRNKVHDRASGYGFFPFDGNLAATDSKALDYGFGMRMDIEFTLGANGKNELGQDQIFKFSGDDDLWVYIDGNLVLDLGGAHGRSKGEINFAYTDGTAGASATENNTTVTVNDPEAYQMYSKGQTAGTNKTELPSVHYTDDSNRGVTRNQTASVDRTKQKHTMTIFYMERGKHESNLKIGFSFSPVSNEFETEKSLNLDNVSANTTFKTAVETLANEDQFTFSNTWSDTADGPFAAPAADLQNTFTHNGTDTVKTTGGTAQIPNASTTFKAGDVDSFVDKFTSGKYFKLTEKAAATNKFNYDDVLVVTDVAQNDARVLPADAANGVYKFDTVKPNANPNVDPVLIKATHVNTLKTKSLTIKKEIDEATDATTTFPIQLKIKLDSSLPDLAGNYVAYRLPYVKSDSTSGTLDADGKVSLKQNETITIDGIPENAKVMIVEDVPSGYRYVRTNVVKTGDSSTELANDTTNATVFTIPVYDTTATIHNEKDLRYVDIKKTLTGSGDTTTQFPVTIKVYPNGKNTTLGTTYSYQLNSGSGFGEKTTVTGQTSGLTLNITSAQTIRLCDVPFGAWVEVSEGDVSSTNFNFGSIDVDSNIALSPAKETSVTQQVGFGIAATQNPTVTINNTVKKRSVTVYKKTDVTKNDTDAFVVTLGLTENGGNTRNLTASDVTTGTVTTITDNTVTLNKDDYITLSIPVDATLTVQETSMPSSFYFEKIATTVDGSNAADGTGVYTLVAGSSAANVYVYNLKKVNLEVSKEVIGTSATDVPFLFKVLKLVGNDYQDYATSYTVRSADNSTATRPVNSNGAVSLYAGDTLVIEGLTHFQDFRIYEMDIPDGYVSSGRTLTGSTENSSDYNGSASDDYYGKTFRITNGNARLTITNQKVYNVTVTKTTDADKDYQTYFGIRIYKKASAGDSWTEITDTLSGVNHNLSSGVDVVTTFTDRVHNGTCYNIQKGDTLIIPDIPQGYYIKVVETDEKAPYYHYDNTGTTVSGTSTNVVDLTTLADGNADKGNGRSLQVNGSDVAVTINNKAVRGNVKVKKETNFSLDDGSVFTITVQSSIFGAAAADNYIADNSGTVYAADGTAKTLTITNGKYQLQKDEYVMFTNVPYGTKFKIEETNDDGIGNSPITASKRFVYDFTDDGTRYAAGDTIPSGYVVGDLVHYPNGQYFTLQKDNTTADPTLVLTVHNKIYKNKVQIKKSITGWTSSHERDTTNRYTIRINAYTNGVPNSGDPSNSPAYAANTISYKILDRDGIAAGYEPTGTIGSGGTIQIYEGETIELSGVYVGSYLEIAETAVEGNFEFDTMTQLNATLKNTPADIAANHEIKIITIDPAESSPATVDVKNKEITRKTVTIKKLIDDTGVSDSTSEFAVHVGVRTGDSGNFDDASGAYTSSLGAARNSSFTNGNVSLKQNEEISFEVEFNQYVQVTETIAQIPWQYAFNGIYMNSDAVTDANKKDNGYSLQITGDTTFNIHNKINCQYIINYKYTPYLLLTDAPVSTLQSYTVTGTFIGDQLTNLVTWNTDKLEFKSGATEARKNFLSGKAPFEDNFMQTLTWDSIMEGETGTANTTVSYELQSGVKTLIVDMEAVTTTNRTVNVYFKLPYSVNDNLSAADGTAKLASGNYIQQSKSTQYGKWVTLNNVYDDPDTAQFVTAPEYVMNGSTKEYFHHWNITSAGESDSRNAGKQSSTYKKCYYKEFNMTMYHDCYVEPVFVAADTPFSPSELSLADTNSGEAAINFIENSRNQWNNNGGTSPKNKNRQTEGDRIYSDFVLTFGYKDLALNGYVMDDDVKKYYQPGFVLEKVAEVKEGTKTAQEYKTLYASTENSAFVEYYITGSGSVPTEYDATKFLANTSIKATQLDNKNQMKYSFSLPVRDDRDLTKDTNGYKNYVYRAYSYLKAPDGTLLKVSEPVYFTIYDMASVNNGTTYTGGGQS